MKISVICTLTIGLLLSSGCRSSGEPTNGPSLGPGSNASMYVLRTVAGDPLPAILVDHEHARVVSIADTIWLEPDGTGVEVATERSTDKGTATTVVHRHERPFTYALAGDRIEVSFECNDVIIRSCLPPPHLLGVLQTSDLVLQSALYYRTPLVYELIQR